MRTKSPTVVVDSFRPEGISLAVNADKWACVAFRLAVSLFISITFAFMRGAICGVSRTLLSFASGLLIEGAKIGERIECHGIIPARRFNSILITCISSGLFFHDDWRADKV